MSHRDYAAKRSKREPRIQAELEVASSELLLGEALVGRRLERNLSHTELADITGILPERLAAIEEGEAMSLHELLWLLRALDCSVTIDADSHLTFQAPSFMRRSAS